MVLKILIMERFMKRRILIRLATEVTLITEHPSLHKLKDEARIINVYKSTFYQIKRTKFIYY